MSEADEKATVTARDICQHFDLEEEAQPLLSDDQTPEELLELLLEHEHFADAARLLANRLPKREAVWWACRCVRRIAGNEPADADTQALEAAEQWVMEPNEDHRRATMPLAEALEFGTPASWAAVAAFWSEGSLAPPDAPDVPPDEHLAAKAVAGAVILAAVLNEPEKAGEKYQGFFGEGKAIAAGELRWPESSYEKEGEDNASSRSGH